MIWFDRTRGCRVAMHMQWNTFQGKIWWRGVDICCKFDMAGSVLGLCTFVDRLIADFGIVLSTRKNSGHRLPILQL